MSADPLSPARRSALMGRIRGRDTRPEMRVRRLLHRDGYRFRLHARDLPGRPDIVFRPSRKIVFVHGCFWHRHEGCPRAATPRTRVDYWTRKFEATRARDAAALSALEAMGWTTLVVWECELNDENRLLMRLRRFLDSNACTRSDGRAR